MQKKVLTVAALSFVMSTFLVLAHQGPAAAEESQLIRIFGGMTTGAAELNTPIHLEPPTMTINKGAVVVWLNWARNAECVQVSFEDGKKCEDVTDAPTGFDMAGSCYVTSWITFGGTSSLRFTQPGIYTYTVSAKSGGQISKETGKIFVKAD